MTTPENDSGDVIVAAKIGAEMADLVERVGGGNRSAGIRTLLCLGAELAADPTFGDRLQLANLLSECEHLARNFPQGWTPAGSRWYPSPDRFPADGAEPGAHLLTAPGVLVLTDERGLSLAIDARDSITALQTGSVQRDPLELTARALLEIVVQLPIGLSRLAETPGGTVAIVGDWIRLERVGTHVGLSLLAERFTPGTVPPEAEQLQVAPLVAWRLAAELAALNVSRVGRSIESRRLLERSLQASPDLAGPAVEVAP